MNDAQIKGMRGLWESATCFKCQPMTAQEMALTEHELSPSGEFATLKDGRVYLWDKRFQQWSPWK